MTPTQTLEALIGRLTELSPDSERRWGNERAAYGRTPRHHFGLEQWQNTSAFTYPRSRTSRRLAHLWSDKPIPKGIRAVAAINEPLPLRFANLDEARAAVQRQYAAVAPYFAQHPDARPMHPCMAR